MLLFILVVVFGYAAPSPSVNPCDPANHICEGVCPKLPGWVQRPSLESSTGICLQHSNTEACVCWLRNPTKDQHLKTLFKCDVIANDTVKHVMCVPPRICFPPGPEPGCLIVPHCPCAVHSGNSHHDEWYPIVAFIYRSNISVYPISDRAPTEPTFPNESTVVTSSDSREFSMKHLLFLLAFVIAPLLCWCLLTFFHEGKCRKKQPELVAALSPVPFTEVAEGSPQTDSLLPPTAPKFESPPPYREAGDSSENCFLEAGCGPPPSYEDVVKEQWLVSIHRNQEPDSD